MLKKKKDGIDVLSSKSALSRDFYLKVVCSKGSKLVPPQTVPAGVPYYQLTLSPPVILHNYLPYNIQYSLEVSCLPWEEWTHLFITMIDM